MEPTEWARAYSPRQVRAALGNIVSFAIGNPRSGRQKGTLPTVFRCRPLRGLVCWSRSSPRARGLTLGGSRPNRWASTNSVGGIACECSCVIGFSSNPLDRARLCDRIRPSSCLDAREPERYSQFFRMTAKKILVVDDSPTMRRMVLASLGDLKGVEFDEASSGLEAIERLALSSVSLIILDLNMPDMHGMEVVEFVRKHQSYRSIPIIVLTTRGDETSRSAALAAGASLYLTKPFLPQVLAANVSELLPANR